LSQLGFSALLNRTEPAVLIMATTMTAGMTLLMRYRGWLAQRRDGRCDVLPFIVLLAPFWLGMLSGRGHGRWPRVMIPCMILLMLRRRREYGQAIAAISGSPVSLGPPQTKGLRWSGADGRCRGSGAPGPQPPGGCPRTSVRGQHQHGHSATCQWRWPGRSRGGSPPAGR
jgi:hypothetical protein